MREDRHHAPRPAPSCRGAVAGGDGPAPVNFDLAEVAELAAWAYVVIVLLAAGDAILPVLPSETVVILGGVLASQGDLSIWGVGATAAVGAIVGDNLSYQLGHAANRKGRTTAEMSGRFGKMLGWAEAGLESRGTSMVLVGRFIPGGRTALTFGAGYVRFDRPRFAGATVVAGVVWAAYAAGIGYLGGEIFHDAWWKGLAAGLAVSLAITGLIEVVRKARGGTPTVAETRADLQARRSAASAEVDPETP